MDCLGKTPRCSGLDHGDALSVVPGPCSRLPCPHMAVASHAARGHTDNNGDSAFDC